MAIGGVGSYGNYTNSYVKNNTVNKVENTEQVEDTSMTSEEFLKELKKEFPDVKFLPANVSKRNWEKYAGSGTGNNNIAVSEKYLNDVAKDPMKREEFKQTVREIKDATEYMQKHCDIKDKELLASGFMIDEDGGLTSWSSTRRSVPTSKDKNANLFGTVQGNNVQAGLIGKVEDNREKRRLEQKEHEEKRLEKRELERKEEKEAQDARIEKQRYEKRLEERRASEKELEEKLAEIFTDRKVEHTFIYDDEPKAKHNFVYSFNSPSIKFKSNIDIVAKYQNTLQD